MRTAYEKQSIEIIQQAAEEHGEGLKALLSYGNDSALIAEVIKRSGVDVGLLTINTGFRLPGTDEHQARLTARYRSDPLVSGPSEEEVEAVAADRLWETDPDSYYEITKDEPLRRAKAEQGITALLSGARHGQTANRATLRTIEEDDDSVLRIYPLLHWTEDQAAHYFQRWRWPNLRGLPRHPLYKEGYGSIGDWTTTKPGEGREGRELPNKECGLHIAEDGSLVRAAA